MYALIDNVIKITQVVLWQYMILLPKATNFGVHTSVFSKGFWAWASSTKFDKFGGILELKSIAYVENWLNNQDAAFIILLILKKAFDSVFQSPEPILCCCLRGNTGKYLLV